MKKRNLKKISYIEKQLLKIQGIKILNITYIPKLPLKVTYIDWSLGWELEDDYCFEIEVLNKNGINKKIYCVLSSLLNVFIIKSKFFKQKENVLEQINLNSINNE